jgi:hypothetical protein
VKKIFVSLIGLTFLLISLAAFADPSGTPAGNPGQMSAERQKFFQETKELRKERHDIRCELQEATQAANPDEENIASLKKQLATIRGEIQARAKELGVTTGAGKCDDPGANGNCGQKRPLNCSGAKQVNSKQ